MKYRAQAISEFKEGSPEEPTPRDLEKFSTGFNMGWDSGRKALRDDLYCGACASPLYYQAETGLYFCRGCKRVVIHQGSFLKNAGVDQEKVTDNELKARLKEELEHMEEVQKKNQTIAEESFNKWLLDKINELYIEQIKAKRIEDLAVCQMHCAEVFFFGAGVDIEEFIRDNALNTKEFLDLAKREHIKDYVIKAIKDTME